MCLADETSADVGFGLEGHPLDFLVSAHEKNGCFNGQSRRFDLHQVEGELPYCMVFLGG